ncbi:hypothetical protein [Parapedobacter tibetensis]|uniref:hypothetical protein n=1 Tax=Parapedobacter tibetensis TaxID=2972951 RepID=UPI00214D1BAB|nr:hypothetical protein [Parapedobacter tibetensis]
MKKGGLIAKWVFLKHNLPEKSNTPKLDNFCILVADYSYYGTAIDRQKSGLFVGVRSVEVLPK